MNIIKKLSLTMLALSWASVVFGASRMDQRISDLESQIKDLRAKNAMGNYGVTTAPSRANVDGIGGFILVGPVYQQVRVGGTEFAYTDDDPAGTIPINGRTKDMNFDWDWGIRVGAGYNFEHDNWDVLLNFTWLDSNGSRSTSGGLNGSVVPLKGASDLTDGAPLDADLAFCSLAKSQFDANFYILNLELGRSYFISGMLSLRPSIGLQSTWINLEQVTRYSGGTILTVHTVDVKDNSDWWGMGPRALLDTKWYLGYGFNIFGNVSGALLFGRFDVDHREKLSIAPDTRRIKLDANKHNFVPTAQFQLGLGWDKYFNENKQHVSLRIGYDAQFFWRANQMLKIDQGEVPLKYSRYSEDAAIYGLMIDARITF